MIFFSQSVREKPYPDEERVKGDPGRDLATIHHLCEANLQELQNRAKTQVRLSTFCYLTVLLNFFIFLQTSIKTLVTVTEMLTKHKQKYTEMINNGANSTLSTNHPAN